MWRHFRKSVVLIAGVLLVSACSSSVRFSSDVHTVPTKRIAKSKYGTTPLKPRVPDWSKIDTRNLSTIRKEIIEEAEKWYGTPYCYGGENRNGADCSGFVMSVFEKCGVTLPRTAAQQSQFGKKISLEKATAGDLVFFSRGDKVSHVGIYVGDSTMLHASSSLGVTLQGLAEFGGNPAFYSCRNVLD